MIQIPKAGLGQMSKYALLPFCFQAEPSECSLCGEVISDRYIFQVASRSWHAHCLRCCVCNAHLDSHNTCFLKDDQLYCKMDYSK